MTGRTAFRPRKSTSTEQPTMRILAAFAVLLAFAAAPAAYAQEQTTSTQRSQANPRVPYTGVNVSGQPLFAGGKFRWASHPAVATVDAGSPAHRVGIRRGDVVLLVNGSDARDPETLLGAPGTTYVFRIRRGGEVREYTVTSTSGPPAQPGGRR
jgi:S1-C subfamily serine protease